MEISSVLTDWYRLHKRDLPWRNTRSPYRIWLSEIILQQTRVNQGLQYYLRFVEKFPEVSDLAAASQDEVMKLWQGLGYYSRARNLHETARIIASQGQGAFPASYKELLKMKGIGPYTAAAVASLAYDEPVAVVDGNVLRVISRLFAISDPVDSPAGRSAIDEIAMKLLDVHEPGTHNQAMMELGAMVCLPRNPLCETCPVESRCIARQRGIVHEFPVKLEKRKPRSRYLTYLFFRDSHGNTLIRKRSGKDIWHSLYEFPLVETAGPLKKGELVKQDIYRELIVNAKVTVSDKPVKYKHILSHQVLHCNFYRVSTDEFPVASGESFLKVPVGSLHEYAVPRLIENYLNEHVTD
jgi:A/G-specific adenine glycosylase